MNTHNRTTSRPAVRRRSSRLVSKALIPFLLLVLVAVVAMFDSSPTVMEDSSRTGSKQVSPEDSVVAAAFENRQSGIQVMGQGTVTRVLSDDTSGDRHQRFIIELASGQTLLIAHNIDIAPRIPSITEGEFISFGGVYEWNEEGGVIHWTHHDPDGRHKAGWIEHGGLRYQ